MSKETKRNSKKGYVQVSTQANDGEADLPDIVNEQKAQKECFTCVDMGLKLKQHRNQIIRIMNAG